MKGILPATPYTVAVFGRNGTLIFAWRFGGPKPDLDREIGSTSRPTGTTNDYGNYETTLDYQKYVYLLRFKLITYSMPVQVERIGTHN